MESSICRDIVSEVWWWLLYGLGGLFAWWLAWLDVSRAPVSKDHWIGAAIIINGSYVPIAVQFLGCPYAIPFNDGTSTQVYTLPCHFPVRVAAVVGAWLFVDASMFLWYRRRKRRALELDRHATWRA